MTYIIKGAELTSILNQLLKYEDIIKYRAKIIERTTP